MAYVSPATLHDPTVGAFPPSSWGDALNTALDYLATNRPHARVYNSGAISAANNAFTTLTFDSERQDVGGLHSTSSNTGRFTIVDPGFYFIGATFQFTGNGTGFRFGRLLLNGATSICSAPGDPVNGVLAGYVNISTCYQLVATDYVEVQGWQNSGGALNVVAQANESPEFYCYWLST